MRAIYLAAFVTLVESIGAVSQTRATPTQMVWATFVRAGPGHNYGTIDEIDRGEKVSVLGCDRGWCAITWANTTGYIEQDALKLPSLPNGKAPAGGSQGCFEAPNIGWLRPVPQDFCEIRP